MIHLPEDGILVAWLDAKTGKSQSWKTHVAYHTTAIALRTRLQQHGYDLLMELSDDRLLAGYLLIVQQWAGSRAPTSKHKGEIAASTYNHRLAVISSLFEYAKQQRLYTGDNPIDHIERRTVHALAALTLYEQVTAAWAGFLPPPASPSAIGWVRVEEERRWVLPGDRDGAGHLVTAGNQVTDEAIRTYGRRHMETVTLAGLPPLPEEAWEADRPKGSQ